MLEVKNLHASVAGKEILKGINLTVNDGEIHAIMGPNGSGKSTLSAVLTGNPLYTVTEGEACFNGKDLLKMKPEERACEGLFLSFQHLHVCSDERFALLVSYCSRNGFGCLRRHCENCEQQQNGCQYLLYVCKSIHSFL